MTVMKSAQFVKKAKDIATKYKTLYVMGCFGAPLTAAAKKRYTSNNSYNEQASRRKLINAASSNTFGFDCVCLIKGILWGWSGKTNATYGGAVYGSNGVPDVGADSMISNYCTGVSKDFRKITVGEAVWMSGHIGIYIGDGLAVECTPIWDDGVQITAVGNIGKKTGYHTRTWTKHGKLKFIDYTAASTTKPSGTQHKNPSLDQLVTDVINGKYGSGAARKSKLNSLYKKGEIDYTYEQIQEAVNQKLESAPVYHKVVKGDTLSELAEKYHTTTSAICKLNNLKNPNMIILGQKLRVK